MAEPVYLDPTLDRVRTAVRAMADLVTHQSIIAVDMADLQVVFSEETGGGWAAAGHGMATGPDRAIRAAEAAIADLKDQIRAARRQP